MRLYKEISENPFFDKFTIYNISDFDELDRIVLKEKKVLITQKIDEKQLLSQEENQQAQLVDKLKKKEKIAEHLI